MLHVHVQVHCACAKCMHLEMNDLGDADATAEVDVQSAEDLRHVESLEPCVE